MARSITTVRCPLSPISPLSLATTAPPRSGPTSRLISA